MIEDGLLRLLSTHTGRPQAFAKAPTPMTGGFWAAIYAFELAEPSDDLAGPLVLRVMPNPRAAVVETIVQRAVADQGYPTPRVLLAGTDEGVGGAFMVMQRVEGTPLLDDLGIGKALWSLPKILRRVARDLSIATVRLHELDPQPIHDALVQAGVDVAALGPAARLDEIRRAAALSPGGFDALLAWLERQRPAFMPAVVCHGDIHPFNMLVNADESYNLLDWTNGCMCRREYDVGCTAALLQCAPIAVPRFAERPLAGVLTWLAHRFIDNYRRIAPINLDVVEWFEVLQYGRCLAAVVTAPVNDPIVGPNHPFRLSAPAMIRQLRTITDVTIELPPPPDSP